MIKVKIPIKTLSEANKHESWWISSKRHKMQKNAVKACLCSKLDGIRLPCRIKMTRIAPRRLDYDENLPMAFKWIKDALAELIKPGMAVGRADDDKRFRFEFDQRKGEPKEYAIEIEIENIFLVRNIDLDHEDFKKSMEKCKVIICNNHEGKSC